MRRNTVGACVVVVLRFRLPCAPMTPGHALRIARLRFAVPLVPLLLTACPPPPPPPPPKVEAPPPQVVEPPPPPLTAARWIEAKGNTLIGPELAEGTLVLLGGRRVLVAKDGTAKAETVPSPEGLVGFTEVMTTSGTRKVIAFSEHAVYRLDDPLGEPKTLARTDGEVWKISAGPGVVAVWDFDSDVARFIDVETGQLRPIANMPAVPANGMAFRNGKEGAAVFEAAGLAITTDGGATWKPAAETAKGDLARVNDLRLRGDVVYASLGYGRAEVPIDFAQGKLGTAVETQIPTTEPAVLKWIRRTERDPLAEVAQSGVILPGGEALVASSGLLARVDLKSGLVTELADVGGEEARACTIVRGGDSAWLGCSLRESESSEDVYDPFGVYKISLQPGKLAPERPVVKRSGEVEMRAAPSGAVMLLGGCGPDGTSDELCVRQPDGKWSTVRPSMDPWERGAGPLADGRVAYVRGLYMGEDPPEDVAPPPSRDEGEGEAEGVPSEGRKAWIVAMDTRGKETTIATISLSPETTDLAVRGFLQEDDDRRLHAVVVAEEGPSVLIATPGKTAAEPQRVQGASAVKLMGNFGVAFGEGKIQGTTDGGATWAEVSAPARVLELVGGGGEEGGYYGGSYMEDYIGLSDAGLKADQFVRLGWGAAEPLPEERQPTGGILLQRRASPPAASADRVAQCTTDGAGTGVAPINGSYQTQDLLVKGQPAKGTRRKVSTAPSGRFGMLDTVGAMFVEGPEKAPSLPAKWSFFWLDPMEIGAKVKTVTAPAPKDASWEISMRSAAASGTRAIFSFRSGSKYFIVRTKGAGIETAEVASDLMPSMEVVIGTEKGEPIVWMAGTSIVAWLTGEQPRVVATITGRAVRSLGQPTKDGIPVLLTSTSWSLLKTLPIPVVDKKDKSAKPAAHPQSVWLDGWSPIANFRRDLGQLPACGKAPKGIRVMTSRYSGAANVDGTEESTQMAAYDLRVNGNDVCVAGLISFLSPIGRYTAPPKDPKAPAKPGGAVPGPVSFLRYDIVGSKAEGGDRGLPREPPKGAPKLPPAVRKLTCKYDERK